MPQLKIVHATARRGKEARAFAETHFGIATMCQAYGTVYRSLVPGD